MNTRAVLRSQLPAGRGFVTLVRRTTLPSASPDCLCADSQAVDPASVMAVLIANANQQRHLEVLTNDPGFDAPYISE
jgi:hypothetical protein